METKSEEKKLLPELAKQFPDIPHAVSEITTLGAMLNLPKGTEHFMSDLHGEHEAFTHIRRCASGVIRRKLDALFGKALTKDEIGELATLIYYPEEKLDQLRASRTLTDEWYSDIIEKLALLCITVGEKYTRNRVISEIKSSSNGYSDIVLELVSRDNNNSFRKEYRKSIIRSVIRLGAEDEIILALANIINALVIDRLHIVGDIFDRGSRADIVMDEIMKVRNIDIQWGNHDALWIGAAAGSDVCIATVINNSIAYNNTDMIEMGYGISLSPLALFAMETYKDGDIEIYKPRKSSGGVLYKRGNDDLLARMRKAISIIQFKAEGQSVRRNPKFNMEDRLLLDKMDLYTGKITVDGVSYKLLDTYFPTLDPSDPYRLTESEEEVMNYLRESFTRSARLDKHIRFLIQNGGMYTVYNRNLLFHGCIPLDEDGQLIALAAADGRKGRDMMDYFDGEIRRGFTSLENGVDRRRYGDLCWFLWCGRDSPLCARKKIAALERLLIEDSSAHTEHENPYYRSWNDKKIVEMILREFSLSGERCHIINGHIPVNKGELPIKAEGRLIVIDGGFCKAFHDRTGIAGYTLIYNADGMRISAHQPFTSKEDAVKNNADILSETTVFEERHNKIRVRDTDEGVKIRDRIGDLMLLVEAYKKGDIKEGLSAKVR